ncbi:MAG: hypothetical protein AAFV43_09555 [Planctomycetota bacterium]
MYIIVAIVLGLLGCLSLWKVEQHRRSVKCRRLADRAKLSVADLVRKSFPNQRDISDDLEHWWVKSASILRLDPGLLRSEDRFDGVLSPVDGYLGEDEIEELGAIVEEQAPGSITLVDRTLDTFGDYVLHMATYSKN